MRGMLLEVAPQVLEGIEIGRVMRQAGFRLNVQLDLHLPPDFDLPELE